MWNRVVATAGTSAFAKSPYKTNAPGAWLRAHPELEQQRFDPRHHDAIVQAWVRSGMVIADTGSVSAEYSAFHQLNAANRLSRAPHVTLIHTASPDGSLAAALVAKVIERDFNAVVTLRAVPDIDPDNPEKLRHALGDFMHAVADELRKGEPSTTCFVPLGGYKVMTSLGYLAGAFMRFPSVYLHEAGQLLHHLPPFPIAVDDVALRQLAPLLRRTKEAGVLLSTLSDEERALADANVWLFERTDGDDALLVRNAFAEFLSLEPQYQWLFTTPISAEPAALGVINQPDQRKFIAKELRNLSHALTDAVAFRATLHHETDFSIQSAHWHLYKGSSNNAGVFRAVYQSLPDALIIRRIWLNHDAYEREASRRSLYEGEPVDPQDVTEHLVGAP